MPARRDSAPAIPREVNGARRWDARRRQSRRDAVREQSKDWGTAPTRPRRNVPRIEAQYISRVVVHPKRAKLDCDAALRVETDGPIRVRLAGCHRAEGFG